MNETRFPWQVPYLAALTQLDSTAFALKIGEAERVIAARLCSPGIDPEELEALKDALRNLRFLLEQNKPNSKSSAA